jgi:1,4-dihydroxy-6-naphthoate synthase
MQALHPDVRHLTHCVFSEIMPALARGDADFGVCIHEGRFTYESSGLLLAEDLGLRYETLTGHPLPLGGIFAQLKTPHQQVSALTDAVRASIHLARSHPPEVLLTMRKYATELDDAAIHQHVNVYVNDFTVDLGAKGKEAVHALEAFAKKHGLLPHSQPRLQIHPQ